MRGIFRYSWWLALIVVPSAVDGRVYLRTTIEEGSSVALYVRFLDQTGAEIVPDSVKYWVDDERSGTRLVDAKDCPDGCSPWPSASPWIYLPVGASAIVDSASKEEARSVSVMFVYPENCVDCRVGTEEFVFSVRNNKYLAVNSATVGPAATPTQRPTHTPTRTPR